MLAKHTPGKPMFLDRKDIAKRERAYMCFGAAILLGAIGVTIESVRGDHAHVGSVFGLFAIIFLAASVIVARAGKAR